jgi:hypothetical protein
VSALVMVCLSTFHSENSQDNHLSPVLNGLLSQVNNVQWVRNGQNCLNSGHPVEGIKKWESTVNCLDAAPAISGFYKV